MTQATDDSRYASQRLRGFHWLRFDPDLEAVYQESALRNTTARNLLILAVALAGFSGLLQATPLPGWQHWILVLAMLLCAGGTYLQEHTSRDNFLLQGELQRRATVDALTGALNRRGLFEHLERIWRQAEREGAAVGLVFLDLDHFKHLNDQYGHRAGDQVLRRTAEILQTQALRPLDAVGRYGGDEFMIAWYNPDTTAFAALARLLPSKLWAGFAGTCGRRFNTIASGGAVLVWPGSGNSIDAAIAAADRTLYAAKRDGHGQIAFAAALRRATDRHSAAA